MKAVPVLEMGAAFRKEATVFKMTAALWKIYFFRKVALVLETGAFFVWGMMFVLESGDCFGNKYFFCKHGAAFGKRCWFRKVAPVLESGECFGNKYFFHKHGAAFGKRRWFRKQVALLKTNKSFVNRHCFL